MTPAHARAHVGAMLIRPTIDIAALRKFARGQRLTPEQAIDLGLALLRDGARTAIIEEVENARGEQPKARPSSERGRR